MSLGCSQGKHEPSSPSLQQKTKPGLYNYRLEKSSTSRRPPVQGGEGHSVGSRDRGFQGLETRWASSLKGLTIFGKTRQTLGVTGKTPLLHTEIPSTRKLAGAQSQAPEETAKPRRTPLQPQSSPGALSPTPIWPAIKFPLPDRCPALRVLPYRKFQSVCKEMIV